ncbi:MAG TPA: efflux RND transporter periplasmic adaptor subunit [Aliiroseovarius sp.]|nr:efflux RND transporter periplasmic adaptor subunit [Aliiroseovarius sp.]
MRRLFSPLFLWMLFLLSAGAPRAQEAAPELLRLEPQPVVEERVLDAVIEAVNQATVSAQTSGRVTAILVDVDDVVNKGDVLLRMRDREQRARFNAAKARHIEAEAEYRRVKEIFAKKLVARAQLDRAEAQLKAAKAALEQAQENLENTVVRAPYSGIVVKRYIEVGETARVGKPLFTGLSLESLRATVNLPQDMIQRVRELRRARVIAGDGNSISAESLIISPYADPLSHTFLLRVNLPPGQHGLYPGMAVKAAFVTRESRKLLLPLSAVARRSEVSAVYVMDGNGRMSMRHVRLGRELADGQVEVLAGLVAGEQVARDPLAATVYLKEQQARRQAAGDAGA